MLDLSKPLRTRGGMLTELVAIVEPGFSAIEELLPVNFTGRRDPGQTVLIRRKHKDKWTYQWYYPSGVFCADIGESIWDLQNVPEPPVVTKTRRAVRINGRGDLVTTGFLNGSNDGLIEFTVTDGKLTNVEIVE